jgi:hypothetical protein
MNKLASFLVILTCLTLLNCKPKRIPGKTYFDKPSEYNDYIVKEQKDVMSHFDDFANAVNAADKDSMSFMRKALYDRAEIAESQMNSLADYKGDTLFRYKALELFRYVKYACDHELKDIFMIASKDSALSEIDVERIHTLSETYTAKEKEKNDALIDAQEKFAYKFNMEVK